MIKKNDRRPGHRVLRMHSELLIVMGCIIFNNTEANEVNCTQVLRQSLIYSDPMDITVVCMMYMYAYKHAIADI